MRGECGQADHGGDGVTEPARRASRERTASRRLLALLRLRRARLARSGRRAAHEQEPAASSSVCASAAARTSERPCFAYDTRARSFTGPTRRRHERRLGVCYFGRGHDERKTAVLRGVYSCADLLEPLVLGHWQKGPTFIESK